MLNDDNINFFKNIGIDVINEDRNYWFIRTQGGLYFDEFYFDGFVGIEWDEISNIEHIKNNTLEELKNEVIKYYPKIGNHGYVAGQIKRFVEDIKEGDIVLIPNANSERIAFGEIINNEIDIYEDNSFEDYLINYDDDNIDKKSIIKKRRKVRWIKNVKRIELDPYLYKIIYSHSAIVDAKPYEVFIDRILSQFYLKGDKAYLTYKVNQKKDIAGVDISGFVYNSLNLLDSMDEDCSKKEITTKINVQSQGVIQFIGPMFSIFALGIGVNCLIGGEISFLGLKFKTDGFSKTILKWVEVIHKIKVENKVLENNIRDPALSLNIGAPDINLENELCSENAIDEVEDSREEN